MLSLPDLMSAAENPDLPLHIQRQYLIAIGVRKSEMDEALAARYREISRQVREKVYVTGFSLRPPGFV